MTLRKWLLLAFLFLIFSVDGFGQEEMPQDTVVYTIEDTTLVKSLLEEAIVLFDSSQYDQGINNAEKVIAIYKSFNDSTSINLGEAWYLIGFGRQELGYHDKAIDAIKKSIRIESGILGYENKRIAASYNILGNAYSNKREFEKGVENLQKSLEIYLKIYGEIHSRVAISYNNLGNAYGRNARFDKALKMQEKSLHVYLQLPDKNLKTIGWSYNSIAVTLFNMGNYNRSLEFFKKCIESYRENYGEKYPEIARTTGNIGTVYLTKGDYEQAKIYFRRGLDLYLEVLPEHPLVPTFYISLGSVHKILAEHNQALKYYEKALSIIEQSERPNKFGLSHTYNNMGNLYLALFDFPSAREYHEKSLNLKKEIYQGEHPEIAKSYQNVGSAYLGLGEIDKALVVWDTALYQFKKILGDQHLSTGSMYSLLAEGYYEQGAFNLSDSCYQEAFKAFSFSNVNALDKVNSLVHLRIAMSKYAILLRENFLQTKDIDYLKKANEYFENVNKIIDYHRKVVSPASKLNLASNAFGIYMDNIITKKALNDILGQAQYLEQSFTINENSKSLLLFETIQEANALQFAGIPDSLLQKEYDLRINIAYYDKKRQEKLNRGLDETDPSVLEFAEKLFNLNREYESLKNDLESNYPQYYKAKYDLSTIALEEVQNNLLQPKQSLLEYMVGDSSIFIFLVQKDTFEIHEVKHDFPLEDWVREMTKDGIYGYHALPQGQRPKGLETTTIANYTNAAQQIYNKLVAPVAEKLEEEVIIVPDGVLGYVPFEALLTEAPPREGVFRAYPYLLKKHQISYCYSATLLQEMREKQHRKQPASQLLAMAPFFQDDVEEMVANIDTTDLLASLSLRDSLGALKGSGEEIAKINKLWKGTPVYGAAASLEAFQKKAGEYQILHLSTHGKADDRVGDYAYLAFGVPGEEGTFDKLYARDLYNYSLNADMVVLSACETGIGKLQKGEGIVSLARAFAYAGAKSIFSTLWKVNDEKTKDLMVYFYTNLKKGQTKDEALRNAKLKHLRKNKGNVVALHPFFWAGMIGIGDMSALTE